MPQHGVQVVSNNWSLERHGATSTIDDCVHRLRISQLPRWVNIKGVIQQSDLDNTLVSGDGILK